MKRLSHYLTRALLGAGFTIAALTAALPAAAWSDKTVKLIVPAPPGGTMDVLARVIAEQVQADIGQPVIVDNRPGAGGAIGVQAVLAAPADGQALLFTASNVLTEIPLVLKLPYNTLTDLKPVAEMARSVVIMVANPGVPAGNLKELITYAKANRGKLSYASYSTGTVSHYAGLILNEKAGLDLLHVPYKGSPPGLQDLVGGQVPLMFDGLVTSLPLVKSGRIKPIAIANGTRVEQLPQVPTFSELGYPDINFHNWIGAVVSARTAPELVTKINAQLLKSAAAPKVHDRIAELGFERSPHSSPAQLEALVRADYERNAAIVKTFNIKLD